MAKTIRLQITSNGLMSDYALPVSVSITQQQLACAHPADYIAGFGRDAGIFEIHCRGLEPLRPQEFDPARKSCPQHDDYRHIEPGFAAARGRARRSAADCEVLRIEVTGE